MSSFLPWKALQPSLCASKFIHSSWPSLNSLSCVKSSLTTVTENSLPPWQQLAAALGTSWECRDPDNHNGVITHLEPDILKCKVKSALGSITMNKASKGDGIPTELFQILKDDPVKVLHSVCQQIWKTQQWPQDWKRSVFILIPKKGSAQECSNYHKLAFI